LQWRLRKYRGAPAAGATYALSKIKASERTLRKKKISLRRVRGWVS
jgi:hypothetical protein